MALEPLEANFREFLKLLNVKRVEYLLIGGYAVGHHGYPRATQVMDVWVAMSPRNARKMVKVLKEFGFDVEALTEELFLNERSIVRMGRPPFRIEIMTKISGVNFESCYTRRKRVMISGLNVNVISLVDLRKNKAASARLKDLDDLENLPESEGAP